MRKLFFIPLIFIFSCCSLSSWDSRLKLINHTNDTVKFAYYIQQKNDTVPYEKDCKDGYLYEIKPNCEETISSLDSWESLLKDRPENYLRVYIINPDSFQAKGSCEILYKQIFMTRLDYNYQDLVNSRWNIEYTQENDQQ